MSEEKEYVMIKREAIAQLMKKCYRASYMVMLLEYVCQLKDVEITLSSEEVCEVLNITQAQLEDCRKKKWITAVALPYGIYLYQAYDAAILAERIKRRRMLRALNKVPSVASKPL